MAVIQLSDFDAVAFDVEGTLADTIPMHHQARLAAFAEHGYGHITREQHELGPTYGSSTADIIGGILHAAGEIDTSHPFKEHPVVQKIMASKSQLFEETAANGFTEIPGATHFVKTVATRFSGHMALVTSSPERFVLPFLGRYELDGYFPAHLLIGEDTVVAEGLEGKPAPDPYILAMERLGAHNVLVFEDTVSGVASAKQAGAVVIAVACDAATVQIFSKGDLPYPPDFLVDDYAEAANLLGIKL
jgi:beta-phosphoglucomutase-like phosphatase (HAD superfamily)